MGKNITSQRRGRGTLTYRSHGFNSKGDSKYPKQEGVLTGTVKDLLHCSQHNAPLAQLRLNNNNECIIIAGEGLGVGQLIEIGGNEVRNGNILMLKNIPEGSSIFNLEKRPGDGGIFVRASGGFAKVVSRNEKGDVTVKMPSKQIIVLAPECRATIGVAAGGGRTEKPMVKAGKKFHRMRAKGRLYPITSGVAKNAVDHPFGSGRGRHMGKPGVPPRDAPPGRKVGQIGARRTGKKR